MVVRDHLKVHERQLEPRERPLVAPEDEHDHAPVGELDTPPLLFLDGDILCEGQPCYGGPCWAF